MIYARDLIICGVSLKDTCRRERSGVIYAGRRLVVRTRRLAMRPLGRCWRGHKVIEGDAHCSTCGARR